MEYGKLLRAVARKENTTPKEVDKAIREAIKAAGLDMHPAAFIAMCAAKSKDDIS